MLIIAPQLLAFSYCYRYQTSKNSPGMLVLSSKLRGGIIMNLSTERRSSEYPTAMPYTNCSTSQNVRLPSCWILLNQVKFVANLKATPHCHTAMGQSTSIGQKWYQTKTFASIIMMLGSAFCRSSSSHFKPGCVSSCALVDWFISPVHPCPFSEFVNKRRGC